MNNYELKELSEKWGVNLVGFENLIIPLKSRDYRNKKEADKIGKILERKGYRLASESASYSTKAVYCMDNGEYLFGLKVTELDGFRFANISDICGEQIIDKNLFFGFIYGVLFSLFVVFIWWLL